MLLSKIYKRTTTGKIQEWEIEIVGNKYRTIVGQQDGKKVTSSWTTCGGKNLGRANETTPEEQALSEARAKKKKKLEKEYKEDIDEVDNIIFKSPMLAFPYEEGLITLPAFAQPKLDGIRCVATKDGLFSRNGKQILVCPHITDELASLFEKDDSIEFDGELYSHELKDDFDEFVSIVRKGKVTPANLAKSKKHIKYHLYDIRDETKNFSDRNETLKALVPKEAEYLVFVETYVVTEDNLEELYTKFLEAGYEGMMLRADAPYEFQRTLSLLKKKDTITKEFLVVDVLEGKGNRAGMAGKVVIRLEEPTTDGKTTCEANPKGKFAFYKRLLADRKNVIGKYATIEFQNYTPKKSLRFPKMLTIRDYE